MTQDEALKKAQVFIDYHAKHWNGLEESPQELSDAINKALAQPCPTCEALARTVMMDQTGRDA